MVAGRGRRQADYEHGGCCARDGEPLAKVDKITIVSTGDGKTTGAHKLTGEMTEIAAQVPALFEALSGMNMKELMSNVKSMRRGRTEHRRMGVEQRNRNA